MKRIFFAGVMLILTIFAGAQSMNRQIRNLAEEITREYLDGRNDLLIKPRIGIGDFTEESKGAVKNSVGSLVSIMLTDEFSRSTVFSVIERRNLEALMKEYKLSLSGLMSEATAPQLGELQGVEFLLLGSVAEQGSVYVIAARLVDVETGKITAGASVQVAKKEIETESEKYIASTFQSPYGITIAPSGTDLMETGGNKNNFFLSSIDIGYRATKWLSFFLGYALLSSNELKGLDSEKISIDAKDGNPSYTTTRYFKFYGQGIKLGIEVLINPTVRFSLGAGIASILYFDPVLEQDFPDFPVWNSTGKNENKILTNRIIIEGFNHEMYASYHILLSARYLVSPRLSVFGKVGGFYLPEFLPTSFRSSTDVRDTTITSDAVIDENGTFPLYPYFNFSRNSSNERITFSAMGVSFQLGIAVNF